MFEIGINDEGVPDYPLKKLDKRSDVLNDVSYRIFERIRSEARKTKDGDVTWFLREGRTDGVYLHEVVGDLYEGRIGIALFSAALAKVSGNDRYREFASEVASPLVEKSVDDSLFTDMKIGGGHGLGSLVYGFTKLGELLNEPRYTRLAGQIASRLTRQRIEADTVFDVIGGSAGAILGLLALYDTTGEQAVLDRAVAAGEHLLSNQTQVNGVGAWKTISDDRVLLGFSHGIAGIAYALTSLTDATGDERFRDSALESIQYEREKFSEEHLNWPDLRTKSDHDRMTGWCAGRSGIGLARLGMARSSSTDALQREVDDALRGTDPTTLTPRDNVCCGNFGRVEFLLRAHRSLGEDQYLEQAERLATASVKRAETNDGFIVPWQTDHWHNPSFFLGESGIGYTLLRLHHSELPCVLLWE